VEQSLLLPVALVLIICLHLMSVPPVYLHLPLVPVLVLPLVTTQ
jgi:hypothetical protein